MRAATSGWELLLHNRLAAAGGMVLALITLIALAAPLLPLAPPDITDPAARLLPPLSQGHPLGTDQLGRDLLSRLVWGTRVSLVVGFAATALAGLVGATLGIVAGFAGGTTDDVLMRGIDVLLAFPYVLLALAIVAAFGPGLLNAMLAIAVVNVPFFARNIRGVTLGLTRRDFIAAARLAGRGPGGILAFEVLPNVLPTLVVTLSTTLGWMILETAGLSFLGLGAQPPQADLGSMLGNGRNQLFTAPFVCIVPGVMIFVIVVAVNLLGDGIRDVLDPQLKAGPLTRPLPVTPVHRLHLPEAPGGNFALAATDLTTQFHRNGEVYRAVDQVTFAVGPGEALGLVGESGSGKSVTALSLVALVSAPPGRIVGGRVDLAQGEILGLPFEALSQVRGGEVGYVFQDPHTTLHPLFSVGQQLVDAMVAHRPLSRREAWASATELLDRVRIPNPRQRLHALPHQLSGGMRQRIGIALALANRPGVIIADEPTTALDVTVQAQVLQLLDDLRREQGTALLFISHDLAVVNQLCRRVAVMYAGRIVEMGPTTAVLAAPAHPYTRGLMDCVPRLGAGGPKAPGIPGLPPAIQRLPPGCAFAERCPRVSDACRREQIPLAAQSADRWVRCLHPLEAS